MRKIIVIFVLCVAASGCTHLTAPAPSVGGPDNMTSYFWPAQSATYNYVSPGDNTSVTTSLVAGNLMTITTNGSNYTSTVYDTIVPGYVRLNNLSNFSFLRFPDSTMLVGDTSQPMPQNPKITSMVASNYSGFGTPLDSLYVFTDNGDFYVYDVTNKVFILKSSIPSQNIITLLPTPIYAPTGIFYALSKSGVVFQSTDLGSSWNDISTGAGMQNISVIAEGQNLYAVSGSKIYKYVPSPAGWAGSIDLGQRVTSLVAALGTADIPILLASLQDGTTARLTGTPNLLLTPPVISAPGGNSVLAIGANLNINNTYVFALASTGPGSTMLFSLHDASGQLWANFPSPPANIATLTSDGLNTYIGCSDGSVSYLSNSSTAIQLGTKLPAPAVASYVTSLPAFDEYALASGQVFRLTGNTWTALQPIFSAPPPPKSGVFTLLSNGNNSWSAGSVIGIKNGQPRGYFYTSDFLENASILVLDSVQHSDIDIIRYTPSANGSVDIADMPQFTIYYQQGKGPIRIDRVLNGDTTTTTIAK